MEIRSDLYSSVSWTRFCLGFECEEDEVWYDIVQRLLPSERKSVLIPPESELNAIRNRD